MAQYLEGFLVKVAKIRIWFNFLVRFSNTSQIFLFRCRSTWLALDSPSLLLRCSAKIE